MIHNNDSSPEDGANNSSLVKVDQVNAEDVACEKTFTKILRLHLAAAIFMGIQTIAYGIASKDTTVNTYPTIGIQTVAIYCNGPICPPQTKQLKSMDPLFLIVLFVALASFDHFVCYFYGWKYPKEAKYWLFTVGANPFRWIEYSISASIMAWAIAILCGVHDIHLWFLITFMTMIGMVTGYLLEALPKDSNNWTGLVSLSQIKNIIFWIGSTSIFIPWLVMLCYFFAAVSQSKDRVPDFVYAAFLLTLLLFICFGVNSLCHSILKKYDFATAETVYIVLSFTAKTFLAADVFGGLRASSNND